MATSRENHRVITVFVIFIFNSAVVANGTVFDVINYDAKADGHTDDATAFIKAWRAACDSNGTARVVVPDGKEFTLGEVVFRGPCTAAPPITVDILGNLSAVPDPSAYPGGAWILVENVDGVEVTGGGTINGRGRHVWKYATKDSHLTVSLVLRGVLNSKLSNLNFIDSMGFHTEVTDSQDVVVANLTITAPGKSPNTNGIHLRNATNVNITECTIGTGDDCVSIGSGSTNVLVTGVYCSPGHGLSVGSLGKREDEKSVSGITISNCTLNGTANGARIRTYHSSPQINATAIVFRDLVMKQVKNPIIIDQHHHSKKRPKQSSVKISNVKFMNIKGSTISTVAVRLNCSSTFPCENIELNDVDLVPFDQTSNLTFVCSNAKVSLKGYINPPAPTACT